jgi:hypothetical protein
MLTKRNNRIATASAVAEVETFLESLRPGEAVDLILNSDASPAFDVRRTSIPEINPRQGLVVSQPNRKHDHQTNKYTRLGVYTTISAFIDNFQLVDSTQEALLLARPREIHPANLRNSFRLPIALPWYHRSPSRPNRHLESMLV